MSKTYPEINALSMKDLNAALRMGYNTLDNVKQEFKADLEARLAAMEDRKRRLLASNQQALAYAKGKVGK